MVRASTGTAFKLLLWKNYKLQVRRPVGTFFEIFVPTFLFLVLWSLRTLLSQDNPPDTVFCSMPVSPLDSITPLNNGGLGNLQSEFGCNSAFYFQPQFLINPDSASADEPLLTKVGYTPNIPEVANFMSTFQTALGTYYNRSCILVPFEDEGFTTAATGNDSFTEGDFYFGVAFYLDDDGAKGEPGLDLSTNKVHYELRMTRDTLVDEDEDGFQTSDLFPQWITLGPDMNSAYYDSGFTVMQALFDSLILMEVSGSDVPPVSYHLKPMPWPSYSDDNFIYVIRSTLPLILIFAFIYSASSITRELVFEKEQRLKEMMKMMGLSTWVHWLAWFTKCFLFLFISVVIIMIIFAGAEFARYSDGGPVFLLFLLFAVNTICLCFMFSTFFSKSNVASAAGAILFFLFYMPYLFISEGLDEMPQSDKAGACLLGPTCVSIGMDILSRWEASGQGLTSSTVNKSPYDGDSAKFSMAAVYGMLFLDSLIYLLVTWYMENVFPGEYGVPRPWYFFADPKYWTGKADEETPSNAPTVPHGTGPRSEFVEDFAGNNAVGIQIEGLRKVFYPQTGGAKVALEHLDLNMYRDQITALLGHNGAGKTTTISMLVGMYPPTAGTAKVNGHNINDDIDGVRDSLGICPQFDTLFPTLTVSEHIVFYSRLKGLSVAEAEAEVPVYIKDIDLENKADARVNSLSGGQRRAVSCALALCGGSTFVALDEPTSGMDPFKRRHTWDMLLKHKQDRTIILTTHFMEEADILGDRIAILADGELRTVGSSMFLKNTFGVGYHMTVVKGSNCDVVGLLNLVQRYAPEAQMTSNVGSELTVVVPKSASSRFPDMFAELETAQRKLDIASFGMGVTTMEEVFLKVAEGRHLQSESEQKEAEHSALIMPETRQSRVETGMALRLHQFRAMLTKRFVYSLRNKNAIITQILLPLTFTFIALAVVTWGATDSLEEPELLFAFDGYGDTTLRYSAQDTAGNYWSYINPEGEAALAELASQTTPGMSAFTSQFPGLTSDARFAQFSLMDETAGNMSDILLEAARNYNRDDFFQENIAAVHVQAGPLILAAVGSALQWWDGNNFVGSTVQWTSGTTIQFVFATDLGISSLIADGTTVEFVYGDATTDMSVPVCNGDAVKTACVWTPASSVADVEIDMSGAGTTPLSISFEAASRSDTGSLRAFGWFSMQALHGAPQTLNLISNAAIRQATGDSSARIYTYNKPAPLSSADAADEIETDATGFQVAINLVFATGFLMASWMLFIIAERANKAKHIQFVSGVNVTVFWLANYTWDLFTLLFPTIGVLIIFAAFNVHAYTDDNRLGLVFLLFMLMGWAGIPLIYIVSRFFSTPAGGYAMTSIFLIIGGIAMLLGVFISLLLSDPDTSETLRYVFYLVPNFAVGQALFDMYTNYLYEERCATAGPGDLACFEATDYTSMEIPGIGAPLLYLAIAGPVWFALLMLLEHDILPSFDPRAFNTPKREEDSDVAKERQRVLAGQANDDQLVVRDLVRVYNKSGQGRSSKERFTAVDGLTFGIPAGECFGLLGVNGAGKTTTFRMLTGDEHPTEGSIVAAKYNLATHLRQARQFIGYCPQYDALIGLLTAREHLVMYARLRGVPEEEVGPLVSELIQKLDLSMYADKPAGTYSGGNKRKLSTAIAIIGNPAIVFLDEPSTGVDPASRRFLWRVLDGVKANGQSVVLTSHSMEECEALCSRLAIMVNGRFRCMGSPGHLRNKFGKGYRLAIKMRPNNGQVGDTAGIKRFVEANFGGANLYEEHNGYVQFDIAVLAENTWSEMFRKLEHARQQFDIEDYSISETSLEQVFLQFASEQHSDEAERVGDFSRTSASQSQDRVTTL